MYLLSLKLFEVLKFIQFLMLFKNQIFVTSSNFGVQVHASFNINYVFF